MEPGCKGLQLEFTSVLGFSFAHIGTRVVWPCDCAADQKHVKCSDSAMVVIRPWLESNNTHANIVFQDTQLSEVQ